MNLIFTILIYFTINIIKVDIVKAKNDDINVKTDYKELNEHTIVTDSNVFPYVVAVLKKSTYLSAGALIDDSWVLTAADALFLLRDSSRLLRVRLGSVNNKKGGVLLPVKFFEVHPYFDDHKPEFDVALIRLPNPVRYTPSLNPIKLQRRAREVTSTHFIVTAWSNTIKPSQKDHRLESMEVIKRRRLLTLSHLHPTDPDRCSEELEEFKANNSENLMCLDLALGSDPCIRDSGAPVVLNGILWGILSSWKPEDCDLGPGPSFVSLVSANDIKSWIHATTHGHRWNKKHLVSYEYEDNYI